jgi:hypothetical protein
MRKPRIARATIAGAVLLSASALPVSAQAQDFLSGLFGAFGGRPPPASPQILAPFANPAFPPDEAQRSRARYGSSQGWCVRSCDGRYFPISGPDRESRAASCNRFCPASKTELVYGSNIEVATAEDGTPYADLPNALRYRSEFIDGCTCNGTDPVGLATVPIENDPTLRKGDIVAGESGLMVANRGADRRRAANFSPLRAQARGR